MSKYNPTQSRYWREPQVCVHIEKNGINIMELTNHLANLSCGTFFNLFVLYVLFSWKSSPRLMSVIIIIIIMIFMRTFSEHNLNFRTDRNDNSMRNIET